MKKVIGLLLICGVIVSLCACGAAEKQDDPNALTDTEFERMKAIFAEYVGEELEYAPVYTGEWRGGKQYKTENYAYGQYLINMDTDGYVHLVVWVQDEAREVKYNRLEDKTAPAPVVADDGAIYLIDEELGEYGQEVTIPSQTFGEYTYVWYNIPAGRYTATYEGSQSQGTVFVVGNESSDDVRSTLYFTEYGESQPIEVEEGTHLEFSIGVILLLNPVLE